MSIGAGRTEAHSGDVRRFQAGLGARVPHGGGHAPRGVFRPPADLGGNAQPGQRAAQVVNHAELDVGSPMSMPTNRGGWAASAAMNWRVWDMGGVRGQGAD